MKKEDRKKLYTLLEEWTRCEIMARHGPFNGTLQFADYYHEAIEKENKIRELLYGSSDLVKLGFDWNLLKEYSKREKHVGKNKDKKFPGS